MTTMSKEYADALFSLAMDEGKLEETLPALRLIKETLVDNESAVSLLASPAISKEERLEVIDRAFGDALPEFVISFLKVLCVNGDIRCLKDCIANFEDLYRAAQNLSTAYVVSAVPLDETVRRQLKAKLEKRLGRTITLECSVDAGLLGGMVVRVDGKVLDGSLRHRLDEIKEVMNT